MAAFTFLFLLAFLQPGVTSPTEWSPTDSALPVIVVTGAGAANQLRVTGSFVEKSDKTALPGDALTVCDSDSCQQKCVASVPANTVKTLYLCYSGTAGAGVYGGNFSIYSEGYSSEVKNLTLYVSSGWQVFWGVVVVLVGGILAWWVKVYASNRVTRDQALLPVAMYRERLTALDASLKRVRAQLDTVTPNLSTAIATWTSRLNITDLEIKFNLPRRTPWPFVSAPVVSSDYTAFLSQTDVSIALLEIFIKEGLEQVLELMVFGQISSPLAAKTVDSIDALYEPTLTPEQARKTINDLISKARTPSLAISTKAPSAPQLPVRVDQLLIEIRRLNMTAWCVLLAAAVIGTIVAVVLKPGFGTLTDYLICFTTSFGIPVVGGTAIPAQTTAASVTSTSHAVSGSSGLVGV